MDPCKFLKVTKNPDGSLTRQLDFPDIPPTGYNNDSNPSQTVASIDVPLNTTKNTWIRVFHPLNLSSNTKLPVLLDFHGGGFIILSAASSLFNDNYICMARDFPALILAVEYRLAPEHRLPAAYEDAVDAMLWLKQQALHGEYDFTKVVDFTKCFLMGSSSGANQAYHAGLRALELDLEPVKIIGMILNEPFFGGMERTGSEMEYANNQALSLTVTDMMWELSLPIGADRDHEYCNPMIEGSKRVEIKKLPRCYVHGCGGDILVDRQKKFVKMLEEHGVDVVAYFADGGFHGVELYDPERALALLVDMKDFIYSSATVVDVK